MCYRLRCAYNSDTMREDRRDQTIQLRLPNGRRREDQAHSRQLPQLTRKLVIAIPDPETGRHIRLVRPDHDTDSPTAA